MRTIRPLLLVWVALISLLGLTIAASFALTGPLSLMTSMGVATVKAALVYWFFMHLREEGGLIRLAALAGIAWLMIFFFLAGADYATRGAG
ncbi:cytochrome C oxidase subunit IV family protein [Dongia soli]|uniref:Cytochrome C oxidase subunit IV family protein n=1 Tax=Dongia soli TaxID=600628 RepID=A0ABU5EG45_9PROT|nr:cytochrome C oxidase subunit IV family protein [Dongia soli]MDY0884418.1 cytochrome C oxidase subunit IV family protein [Dongia soli]